MPAAPGGERTVTFLCSVTLLSDGSYWCVSQASRTALMVVGCGTNE
jgi:hypothetical protein